MSRLLSILVLLAILVAIGVIFFRVMSGFLVPIFLAALLGVIFQPLHQRVFQKIGATNRYLAAGVTTFIAGFVVIAPTALVITLAVREGIALVNQFGDVSVQKRLDTVREQFQLEIPLHEDLRQLQSKLNHLDAAIRHGEAPSVDQTILASLVDRGQRLASYVEEHHDTLPAVDPQPLLNSLAAIRDAQPGSLAFEDAVRDAKLDFRQFKLQYLGGPYQAWIKEAADPSEDQIEAFRQTWLSTKSPLVSLTGDTASMVGRTVFGGLIMVATLFFLFADGPRLLDTVINFVPLEERYVRELLTEFDRASRAVVLATLLSALAQGLLAGIGYQVAGVGSVFLLTLLTAVLAMVPFLGAASVWISVSLWLYFYDGRPEAAIGLAVYGALVVSLADNVIKPLVLHGQSNLHPLLALLSILGGVQALGPIGILVGPMSVVFLQVLVRILNREYRVLERRMQSGDHSQEETEAMPPEPVRQEPVVSETEENEVAAND
jgi:predicted PurR-regulated permease PerM